ncbi:CD59 glycoprotein [Sorex fumeus]|uniref:CD59 glycoprotein n=1 Tax=Sorex fumeus TaxID=62283 RepID=UPI0024ACDC2C|nr:CD59 glycoprotein [Sorex fumeus]
MGSKGGFTLLGLLLILALLCRSGHSLRCYQCNKNVQRCFNVENCSGNFDACLSVEAAAGQNRYFQCWKRRECNYADISRLLGESQLKYRCCEEDLCNRDDAPIMSGKTALLVVPLLAAAWNVCF